jgi:hypothetical protein
MDKFKIVEIAIDMAADDGVEYDDLSPGRQMSYYKKAYEDYLDRLADQADMMRKNEAGGGFMRQNFRLGSDEDDIVDIPDELEEMPNEEFLDLLKQIGAPQPGQESGIRSLKNKQMASAPDPMDTRNDMMQNLAIDNFGKPLKDLTEDEIIQIEEMMDEMSGKRKAPSIKMAGGDIDPFLLREYEKYAYDMREQGREPMPLKDFIRMILAEARAGVNAGGLTTII